MIKQRTIKQPISVAGIGLHKGEKVNMTLRPAPENFGVVYRRVDINPSQISTLMLERLGTRCCVLA